MTGMPIGAVARQSGVKVPTIRYYEEVGLLPAPVRAANGRRIYDERSIRRLEFIRRARAMDFGMSDIRALLALRDFPDKSCAEADAIARARLADVEQRIAHLKALKDDLRRMVDGCACRQVAECNVIEAIAEAEPAGVLSD